MPTIHYLNVKQGDCSIIQHLSGRISVVDVCNAKAELPTEMHVNRGLLTLAEAGAFGSLNQKDHPVNPITYMKEREINSVFRFILTNCNMAHMDGIKDFFTAFSPDNFWDSNNSREQDFSDGSPYNEDDWQFYKSLRDSGPDHYPKRLTLYSGAHGRYYNQNAQGESGGDGIYVLAPPEPPSTVNERGGYNHYSYVIHYKTSNYSTVFAGDSHDKTWEYILGTHKDIQNIDLLIAPHHGGDSDRRYEFLDVLRPRLTFFGNANSGPLAYSAWNNRKLPFISNNEAGCMIVSIDNYGMALYVTHKPFAKKLNPQTTYNPLFKAYYCTVFSKRG